MGSYAECWVGSFYVGSTKNHIDPGLIELFRSSDKCVVPVTGEQLPRILTRWAQFVDEDELTTVFYRTSVKVVRERLDLLGYTLAAARRAFNISLAAQVRESERRVGGAHGALFEPDHRVLSTLDVNSWLATLRHIKAAGLPPHFNHPTNNWDGTLLGYMLFHDWYGYEGPDQNVGLRLALEVCADDDDFVYDVKRFCTNFSPRFARRMKLKCVHVSMRTIRRSQDRRGGFPAARSSLAHEARRVGS